MLRDSLIVLALAGAAAAQTTVWGGDHVEMQVTRDGARLEFDCARGTIDEAFSDEQGTFQAKGTFTPERGGPSRDDTAPRAAAATYHGTIRDDTMTLRIVLEGETGEGMTFVLARGRRGNVRKCR